METITVMDWEMWPVDDDVLFPIGYFTDIRKQLASIKALPYQAGDILLCTYPKSGTHWVWHLIAKIVRGGNLEKEPPALSGLLDVNSGGLDSLPSPRILVSHLHPKRLPTAHWNTGKIVLVLRNPKDVAVSLYAHLKNDAHIGLPNTSWDQFLESFVSGEIVHRSWFDNIIAWDRVLNKEKKDNVVVLYYEEIKANPIECLKKLQKHLGIEHDEEEFEKIVEECSLSNLRRYCGKKESGMHFEGGEAHHFSTKDGTNIIYRKGVVADWKNHFTVAQNEAFEKVIKEKLKDVKFEFKYE